MLLSVHLPKTAGSSFEEALRAHYGERLRSHYRDRPLHLTPGQRRLDAVLGAARHALAGPGASGAECIHGHFMPLKYRFSRGNLVFVTWLRDPVERLASHFHYWRRNYAPASAGPLHRRVIEEDWSLERFCLGPELRNVYRTFLWGFPLGRFAFVGITEHYAADLAVFSRRFLGRTLAPAALNRNPLPQDGGYIRDPALRRAIEVYHAADMALYRQALAMRRARSQDATPVSES